MAKWEIGNRRGGGRKPHFTKSYHGIGYPRIVDQSARQLPAPPAERFVLLDGLRGVAALAVLMLHLDLTNGGNGPFRFGYLAVDFFFLLSGFVLVPLLEGPSCEKRRAVDVLAKRFARFLPLIAAGAALGAGVHLLRWPTETVLPLFALAVLSLPLPWNGAHAFSLNAPQWSLFIELAINALHLLVLRHLRTRGLLALAGGCNLLLLVSGRDLLGFDIGSGFDDLLLGAIRAGSLYPLGILLARSRHRLDALPQVPWWSIPAALIGVLILPRVVGVTGPLIETSICAAFVALLALGFRARVPNHAVAPLTRLGALSFPLYAIHFPLIELASLLGEGQPAAMRVPLLVAAMVAALGLANVLARSPLARGLRWPRPTVAQTVEEATSAR